MKPIARRSGLLVRPTGSDIVTLAPDHVVHRLGPVAAWVYAHADGTRDVDALLMGLRAQVDGEADKALVFEALDRLADAGLLEARVAPPASLSRRGLITRLAGASALAALTAVVGLPLDALAAGPACGDEKDLIDEIAWLEAESKAVASILEDWLFEEPAEDDAAPDEFYVAELATREDNYKADEASRKKSLDTAEYDLSVCKVEKKKEKLGEREQDMKAHFKKRNSEMFQKKEAREAHFAERALKHVGKEEQHKHQLQQKLEKSAGGNNESAYKTLERKIEANVKTSKEHLQKRQLLVERKDEASAKHFDARQAHLEVSEELANKNLTARLGTSEEHAKVQSDFYARKAQEEASKDAGVTDRALEIAQEESNKAVIVGAKKRKEAEAAQEQQRKMAEEESQKSYAQEEKQKADYKAQEEKEKYSATEQNQKLDLKAQEEKEKSYAAEQKQKDYSSTEQDAKYAELKKEQEVKEAQAEEAKKQL